MDEHITRYLLHAIHQGWRNPGDLAAIALAHLFEQCPACREEFEAWRRQVGEGVARPEGGDFDAALDRICGADGGEDDELASEAARVEAERQKARSRAGELLALPDEDQIDWIRIESRGHAGPLLAEALIEESRRKAPGFPWEAITLAHLARTVLQHADATLYAAELYTRALAHLANAIRVTGHLPRSDQILADARYFLRSQGGGDRLVRAELDSLEGSLRLDQRRCRASISLLLRANAVYRMAGETGQSAAVIVKLGNAHFELGEHRRTLKLLEEAAQDADEGDELNLPAIISGNRALAWAGLGDLTIGWECLAHLKSRERPPSGSLRHVRHSWKEAELLAAGGEIEAYESTLASVVDAFHELGLRLEHARAGCELARFLLGQRRLAAAEELAGEAVDVFEGAELFKEAAQARRLRDQAARRGPA